ncbi:hypothetical protein MCAMS1_00629 [biofilm metagenome]
MALSNRRLSKLIYNSIGKGWLTDQGCLNELEPHAMDPAFQQAWQEVKQANKTYLAIIIQDRSGILVRCPG